MDEAGSTGKFDRMNWRTCSVGVVPMVVRSETDDNLLACVRGYHGQQLLRSRRPRWRRVLAQNDTVNRLPVHIKR